MIMVNNPYLAGTHLNDVTVIRPIYSSNRLVAYTANKAHHADVGGKVPGSISIDAKSLFEEGVVIDPRYLIRKNRFVSSAVTALSSKSRTPEERMGDLKAQTAANITGERRVLETCQQARAQVVPAGMRRVAEEDRATNEAEDFRDTLRHLPGPGLSRRS